jgi:arylsulfatase A-like enzyme
MAAVRRMFDGYDTGVRYADVYVGRIVDELDRLGVLDQTLIVITADHGENLGELNIYGDHHTADEPTGHVPMIVRWPGAPARVDAGLHYQFDVAATLLELLGGKVPEAWDASSFAPAFGQGCAAGRDHLVLTQGAWTCQRAVRWENYLSIHTLHDGYHAFDAVMLFDLERDPHQQHDLAASDPERVRHAQSLLQRWLAEVVARSPTGSDPLDTVIREGGPFHVRGQLPSYLERLRATDRSEWAERLERLHPVSHRGR